MGCTSSAPSTLSANGNTAEKMHIIEDVADVASKSDAVEKVVDVQTAVLPSCDLLIETIVNNNKSTASLETEGDHEDQIPDQTELEEKIESSQDNGNEEKLSKLEEVVEKVVEINQYTDDTDQIATNKLVSSGSSLPEENIISNTEVEQETPTEPTSQEVATEAINIEQDTEADNESVENSEDSDISPSEFSRATRWEALADIVAELPPSLAVDPITGQIYSLTK